MKCDWCFEYDLRQKALSMGRPGIASRPMADSRNPLWILTRLYIQRSDHDWGEVKGVIACPSPVHCVCDRPKPTGKQVYGNSRDPEWPHKCPACGYHAAVVADDGVTVIRCRAASCEHSVYRQ